MMTLKNHSKILNKTKATEETYNNKIVVSCTGLCFWKKKKNQPYKYQNFYKCPRPEKKHNFIKRTCWSQQTYSKIQQHRRWLYTWTSQDSQYWDQIYFLLCSWRWRSLYSQQNQDWKLTVAQIIRSLLQNSGLNWKKVGKTIRPFRYDLIHIPYTVEGTNRFKGLDLVESAWRAMDRGL